MAVSLKIVSQVVASGTPGPAGKSAYQIAVDNGFQGTESEWLKELHPFKGWFDSVSELEEEHSAPSVGEYAYVKGATSSDPVKIYECSTEGSWSDSGRTVDTSTVQTFRSGEAVNDVDITDDSSDIEENSDKIPTAGAVANAIGNAEFATGEKVKNVGIDDEPTVGSNNLIKSGGVYSQISQLDREIIDVDIKFSKDETPAEKNFLLKDTGKFGTNGTKKHGCVSVSEGESYYLKSTLNDCLVAFVTTDAATSGGDIPFVSGTNLMNMAAANNYYKFTIPTGCSYLLFNIDTGTVKCYKSGVIGIDDAKFATNQKIKEVSIVNDTTTGGVNDVLTAEQGKQLQLKIDKLNQLNKDILFSEKKPISKGSGVYKNDNDIATLYSGPSWYYAKYLVKSIEGCNIIIQTIKYGSSYPGYLFTDLQGNVIYNDDPIGVSTYTSVNIETIVPTGAVYLYVNKRAYDTNKYPNLKIEVNKTVKNPFRLRLCAVNCGTFHYTDGTTTDEQYLMNWHNMLNSIDYDIIVLEDYYGDFGSLEGQAVELLFGGEYYVKYFGGSGTGFYVVSRNKNVTGIGIIEVTNTLDEKTARRYKVYKCCLSLENKEDVFVYVCHCEPEVGNSDIRAAQFQDIINEISYNNNNAIIAGDFNAWTASEYDVFKTAGYKMGNCSYTGTHLTLRDIPADNIIVTPNMILSKFTVVDGYNLNTDHKPIVADIIISND